MRSLQERILDALPQTQCTRCGYPDCAAYAAAIATDGAAINRCPPGGSEGVTRLAALTGAPVQPLDPACGVEEPRQVAFIDEGWCIGCTLCLNACPTDAIIGSAKHMHTVIEPHCTGCALCLPACPVDCIVMEPVQDGRTGWSAWSAELAASARERYAQHQRRLHDAVPASPTAPTPLPNQTQEPVGVTHSGVAHTPATTGATDPAAARRAAVQAAMARARARSAPR